MRFYAFADTRTLSNTSRQVAKVDIHLLCDTLDINAIDVSAKTGEVSPDWGQSL